jgi:predicted aldo/keto reductase-like oxidoreductase
MIYRKYGKLDISALAFGLFGPQSLTQGFDPSAYLDAAARGIELGVTYFDLGFQHLQRINPTLAGDCGRLLKSTQVVTALRVNVHAADSAKSLELSIRRDLKSYGLDHVSLFQLWGVDRVSWRKILETGMLDSLEELVQSGLADDVTLHFTDDRFYLRPILETGRFGAAALEFSFLEESRNPGSFKTAADYGLGIIAHNATKDGRLLEPLSPEIKAVWDEHPERTPAGWALGLAWEQPGITSVLVEALTPQQAEEYASYTDLIETDKPGTRGKLIGKRVRDLYYAKRRIQCELCRCCMPCPLGIDAPRIAELHNDYLMYGNADIPALLYRLEQHDAGRCTSCYRCTKACPREFRLPDIITEADRLFSRL